MTFTDVYHQHYAFVLGHYLKSFPREEAEDLAQEVFISVYKHLHRYNDKYAMTTFIGLFFTQTVSNYRRKTKDLPETDLSLTTTGGYDNVDRSIDLRRMIDGLNVNLTQKALLRMALIEGRSSLEMQAATGKDELYVRRARIRAMKSLAESQGIAM